MVGLAALALLSGCASVNTAQEPGPGLHVEWLDFDGDTDRKVGVSYFGWAGTSPDQALERVVQAACQAGLEKGVPADRPYLWVMEHASDSTFVNVPVGPEATASQSTMSRNGVLVGRSIVSEPTDQRMVVRTAGAASLTAVLVPQDAVDAGIARGPGLTYIDSRTCTLVPAPRIGG